MDAKNRHGTFLSVDNSVGRRHHEQDMAMCSSIERDKGRRLATEDQ